MTSFVSSGLTVHWARVDDRVQIGDSTLSNGRIIRLLVGRKRFAHLCAASKCISSQQEAASDVVSSRLVRRNLPDQRVKFRDPRLNRSE